MRGDTLKELKFLLCLGILGLISLACSGPGDSSGQDVVDVYGIRVPDEILSSFKNVNGGVLKDIGLPAGVSGNASAGTKEEEAIIYADETTHIDSQKFFDTNTQETKDGSGDSASINSIGIMDSEVTVQMYVDFLNRIAPTQASSGSSSSTTSSLTFSDVSVLYKSVMQQPDLCGIYPQSSDGKRIADPYTEYAGFYVGTAPTTSKPNVTVSYTDPQQEYQKPRMAVTSGTIAKFGIEPGRRNYPVVFVSQTDAKEFCQWLGPSYRLPTWQEWSYAAKGGREVNFATSTGEILKRNSAGKIIDSPYTYLANIKGPHTSTLGSLPVKSFAPNSYGLFDMTGNVYEWTYFREEDQATNGATIPYGGGKFYMGGSYATSFFASSSNWYRPTYYAAAKVWAADLGFRLVFDHSRALTIGAYSGLVVP